MGSGGKRDSRARGGSVCEKLSLATYARQTHSPFISSCENSMYLVAVLLFSAPSTGVFVELALPYYQSRGWLDQATEEDLLIAEERMAQVRMRPPVLFGTSFTVASA